MKRSRSNRSCAEFKELNMSSSNTEDRNKVAKISNVTMMNNEVNPQVPTQLPPLPPLQLPLRMQYTNTGRGYPVLPPTYLDICNYCTKMIRHDEDRYMNGYVFILISLAIINTFLYCLDLNQQLLEYLDDTDLIHFY